MPDSIILRPGKTSLLLQRGPRVWLRRLFVAMLAMALALLVAVEVYNRYALRAMEEEAQRWPRDPISGIIHGAEPRLLPGTRDSAILMIHGFLGTPRDFADLGDRLNLQGHAVRLMLLPGHGTEPGDFASVTESELRQAVLQEYLELRHGYSRVSVVGFSLGGTLASLLASREKPDRLVLLAPYYRVRHRWQYVLRPETWHAVTRHLLPYVIRNDNFIQLDKRENLPRIISYHAFPASGVDALLAIGRAARDPGQLRRIQAPTLLVHSVGDLAAETDAARAAFEGLTMPGKTLHLLERSNHLICWDWEAEAVFDEVLRFLAPEHLEKSNK